MSSPARGAMGTSPPTGIRTAIRHSEAPKGPWESVSFPKEYGLPRRACGPPRNDGQRVVFVGRAGPSPWGEGGPQGRMRGRPARRTPPSAPFGGTSSRPKSRRFAAVGLETRLRAQPRKGGGFGPPVQAPLERADSPCQGEMSRRDKRGRDAVADRLTGGFFD